MKLSISLLTVLVGAGLSMSAAPIVYRADLNGANEESANASPGVGTAIVTVDVNAHTMRVQFSFSGLVAGNTAAHIHCCTALSGTGTAGVATATPTFPGFPTGTTFGSYDNTFDMTSPFSYRLAFLNGAPHYGSTDLAEATLAIGVAEGTAYLNIHSTTYPGGEIRGFLQPVPEPATYALVGVALLGLAVRRRK